MLIDLLMRPSSNQLLVREILRKRTTCALVFRRSETKKKGRPLVTLRALCY